MSASLANPFISRFAVFGAKGWIDIRDKAHVEAPEGWVVTSAIAGGRIVTNGGSAGRAGEGQSRRLRARRQRRLRPIPITAAHLVDNIALLEAVFASAISGQIPVGRLKPTTRECAMKALIFDEPKKPVVTQIQSPSIDDNGVMIRSRRVGICHSDYELLAGQYIIPISYPVIPGHEWVGEVVETGEEREGFSTRRPRGGRVRHQHALSASTTSAFRWTAPIASSLQRGRNGCTSCPTPSTTPRAR